VVWGALGAVLGFGCDGSSSSSPEGIDISGVYAVIRHTRNASSCDVEGADLATYTHFQAVATSRSGYTVVECGSADPASCPSPSEAPFNGQLIAAFDNPEIDGWSLELAAASTISGCHLLFLRERAVLAGDQLHIESRDYGEDTNLAGAACSAEAAAARNTSLACEEFVVVTGTRL
jgi:hypothetical protein